MINMYRKTLKQWFIFAITWVVLLLPLSIHAQLNTESMTVLSEKDGLSSENVSALIVDNKGYIWIGTPNGLSRYDGYEFKRYFSNPIDTTAIQGMLIYDLFEDSKHHIWAGTNPNFLEVFDPERQTFRSYNYTAVIDPLAQKTPLYGYIASTIEEGPDGRIYFNVFTYNDRPWLLYLDPEDDKIKVFTNAEGQPLRGSYEVKRDSSGRIWLLTQSGMMYINKEGSLVEFHELDHEFIKNEDYPQTVCFTADNHAFFITGKSKLIDYDLNENSYRIWQSDLMNHDNGEMASSGILVPDQEENLWIGTLKGIFYFDRKAQEFSAYDKGNNKDLDDIAVSAMAMDHFGNLWIGTSNKGLLRYEEKPAFHSFINSQNQKNVLNPGWITRFMEDDKGNIWIHNDGGLAVLDMDTEKIELLPDGTLPFISYNITYFWEEDSDILLGISDSSVYKYDVKTNQLEKRNIPGLPDNLTILYFIRDSEGRQWYGTSSGLYGQERTGKGFKHYDLTQISSATASSNNVNFIFESKKHGLWLVTDGGLFLYSYEDDSVERHGFDPDQGDVFLTQDINSFYEDPQGMAWVGMWQGGLARYDVTTKKIKPYGTSEGLPSMSVQRILGDEKNGTLWLSTFNGISRFDPESETFNNFSILDGIQGSQFSDGAALKTSKGLFFFGGSNGFTFFDPDEIKTSYEPPEVFLTDLKLFNKTVLPGEGSVLSEPISATKQIILDHDQNDLSIQYVGLHYSNPLKNNYAFRLENYDDAWRNVGRQNEAFYPNLAPGTYLFTVKAANDKGVWSVDNPSLEIIIKPPWWQTWWAYFIYIFILIFLGWRMHLFQRKRVIRQERERIQQRELEQSREIEKAYTELKATQSQLIQSEKMASLGELTAGIAHEIQNPLNFVNNFAEVSTELIDEMNEELEKGELGEVKQISSDLKQNMEKITHHGKRADAIVKGMLQHSRISSGTKELTDINALADEYLRLSYHGLRAKDKSFNADFKTEFDGSLPKVNVVPQDLGRVLLNLINNAFYAVNERSRTSDDSFKPEVKVCTKNKGNHIEISVADNGSGIPEQIRDKIFQPFFTSKPTGQGTGLGLSLSYDIVKAHEGRLTLMTGENEGTQFVIDLPINETA